MVSLNKVMLIGNLVRDPELRYTPGGAAISEFSIAVNRNWTDKKSGEKKEEVSYIDIVSWGRQAEICAEYLKKGRPVFVEGRLTQDRWKDKESGQNRSRMRVTAERVQFLGGRGEGAPAGGERSEGAPPMPEPPPEALEPPAEEDIPF